MHQLRGLSTYRRGYWSFDPEDSRNSGTTAQSEGDTKAIVWIPHGHEREQSPEQLQSDSSLIIVATGSAKYSPQLKQRRLPARHYAFARETGRDPLLPVVSGRFPALPHAQKDTRRATETRAGTRRPRRGLEVCHRQKRGQRVAIDAS